MVSVLFHGKLNKYTGKPLQVRLKPQSKDKTLDEFCDQNAGVDACAETPLSIVACVNRRAH